MVYIIENKAPDTTPIDWYYVGLRSTLKEAEEAVEYYANRFPEEEHRYRKVDS
jgi:hypothetical protein